MTCVEWSLPVALLTLALQIIEFGKQDQWVSADLFIRLIQLPVNFFTYRTLYFRIAPPPPGGDDHFECSMLTLKIL